MEVREPDIKLRILHAAKKLFARQGYEATTVRQICEEAGANVALVSYHFGGKENVFHELFEVYFPNRKVEEMIAKLGDPLESLKTLIRELTLFRLSEPEMINILQQEILVMSPRIELIRKYAFPVWGYLRKVLQAGKEQGVFHFESLDHTFMSVIGSILHHNKSHYFGPLMNVEAEYNDTLIEHLTDYILSALRVSTKESVN